MAALTASRNTQTLGAGGVPVKGSYPVAASTKIYQGGIVQLNSSGLAVAGTTTTANLTVGIAIATADNSSGASSAINVEVISGCFLLGQSGTAIAASDVGKPVYCVDDQTVVLAGLGKPLVGFVYQVNTDGAWILIQPCIGQQFFSAPQVLSGAGAVNVTTRTTLFTSTGAAQALTIADGLYAGQRKTVQHTVDGGSGVLTPATAGNFATFTLTAVHDACELEWSGLVWNIVMNVGGTVA